MPHARLISALSAVCVISAATAMTTTAGTDFDLSWHSMDGSGGGEAAGGTFTLSGSMGQPDAGGPLSGGSFTLVGGFLAGGGGDVTPVCPEDINSDGVIDVNDLLSVLGSWGICVDCAADINGDDLVDVNDLLGVLAAWGPCD